MKIWENKHNYVRSAITGEKVIVNALTMGQIRNLHNSSNKKLISIR